MSSSPSQSRRLKLIHPLAGCTIPVWLKLLKSYGGVDSIGWTQAASASLITTLGTPLRMYERLRFGRAIAAQKLDPPPVFIIGHWRSGTTNMHNHLLRDPQFGHLSFLHCQAPWAFLSTESLANRLFAKLVPATRPMDNVELGLNEPMSEDFALGAMTDITHYHSYYFPRQGDEIFRRTILFEGLSDSEIERWQQTYRYLLQKVAVAHDGKQLLLKNPAHSGRLPTILKMFPNARFIHVYRNPYVVIASTLKLMDRFLHLLALQRHDWDAVREACLLRYQLLMERLLRDKELIPPNQLFEVSHEEMTSRPLEVLERAYSHLSLPGFNAAQPRLQSYVESLANYETNRYRFDDATINHWQPFLKVALDRWGYEPPGNHRAMQAANPAA